LRDCQTNIVTMRSDICQMFVKLFSLSFRPCPQAERTPGTRAVLHFVYKS
jgi:hypothetical protein